nr:hypothetical protein BgiMline_019130 [Biomphalaria glabrata]
MCNSHPPMVVKRCASHPPMVVKRCATVILPWLSKDVQQSSSHGRQKMCKSSSNGCRMMCGCMPADFLFTFVLLKIMYVFDMASSRFGSCTSLTWPVKRFGSTIED